MSGFRLRDAIGAWFQWIAEQTSLDCAICAFAIGFALLVLIIAIVLWRMRPWLWMRVEKYAKKSLKWQVRQIFERTRWCTHTEASTWHAVVCGLIVWLAVWLWIKLPILAPVIVGVVPASLITSFWFACLNRGGRTTSSLRNLFNFCWSFFAVPASYAAVALATAIGLALWDHF